MKFWQLYQDKDIKNNWIFIRNYQRMTEKNGNYLKSGSIELVDITDDDSFEEQVFHKKKVKQTNRRKPPTTSQRFESIMLTSDESEDEEVVGRNSVKVSGANLMEKENIPGANVAPVQPVSNFFAQYTYNNMHPKRMQSTAVTNDRMDQSDVTPTDSSCQSENGSLKTGVKRFFRWTDQDQNEASTSSNSKKRPCTTPDNRDNKRRSIENDQQNRSSALGVPLIVGDAVEEIDPHCGCSGEDVGRPAPMVTKHHRLEIAGIKVDFPLNPYPAQKAVMNALIKGCTKEEHVLIESPTGSGKTLALLCGALAWQSHYAVQYQAKRAEIINQMRFSDLEDETSEGNKTAKINESPNKATPPEFPKRVPKIYYGSRTHRQIAQVVKELGRTVYRDTKMTILSSREFSCIQKTPRNKTELCNELLDPVKKVGCVFYNEFNRREISSYSALERMDFSMPFDVEDLVKLGTDHRCCPYFTARSLMLEADLIFCPYNYLVDPSIRKSMQIDINNAIIILDEAHNIEDICRDTASVKFTYNEIDIIIKECEDFYKQKTGIPKFVPIICLFCTNFALMIQDTPVKKQENQSDTAYSLTWRGTEFFTVLDSHKIQENVIDGFVESMKVAIEHYNRAREYLKDPDPDHPVDTHSFTGATIQKFEKFLFAFAVLRSNQSVQDFRIFIKESTEWTLTREEMNNQFQKPGGSREQIRSLEIHCMNPGVTFSPIADKARTVILASGTLSPIVSFASELETKFKHILQTNHVIPKENVNIKVVAKGPRGINLRTTFKNSQNWEFLDELGRVIADTCQSVPHGILCFMPSYGFLYKLTDRMRLTGIMRDIERVKVVCTEPKTSRDLVDVMSTYRQTIKTCTEFPQEEGINGAILFAVFRGKIAEGIDFSDGESRAVIIIGIPYAVYKDPVVQLKIQYNDEFKQKKDLLKGYDWYTIQAYRALNQALGRCIRHIEDWSSVLLIDERFTVASNRELLPKWVKTIWGNRIDTGPYALIDQLRKFSIERTEADALRKAKAS